MDGWHGMGRNDERKQGSRKQKSRAKSTMPGYHWWLSLIARNTFLKPYLQHHHPLLSFAYSIATPFWFPQIMISFQNRMLRPHLLPNHFLPPILLVIPLLSPPGFPISTLSYLYFCVMCEPSTRILCFQATFSHLFDGKIWVNYIKYSQIFKFLKFSIISIVFLVSHI